MLGGVSYNLYKQSGDLHAFDDAIADERDALEAWQQIINAAGNVYNQNLAFRAHAVGFSRHWKEEYTLLSHDFEKLLADRQKATGKMFLLTARCSPRGIPPAVRLMPANGLRISAKVTDPASIKWMRLRYRHVTQFEDYATADMTLDSTTGIYSARIPASFVDSRWDLMYFVEAVNENGAGRMYPDLDVETPSVILAGKR